MNGFIRWGMLVMLLVLLPVAQAAAAPSSQPEPFVAVDGSIKAIAVDGNTAYVGGDFTRIGAASGPMALMSAADGSVEKTIRDIAAHRDSGASSPLAVHAIEPDGDGGWYVGGTFQRVAGHFRMAVVHLLADGAVDPAFRADIRGDVTAIALDRDNGTLWIGGSFQRVAGEFRPYFAALDAASGELRPAPRVRGAVSDIEIHGDRVYLLGAFDTVNDEDHVGVAALARDSGRLLDWDPRLRIGGASDLDVRDGIVYLAGSFTSVGSYDTPNAAAVREGDASVVPVDFGIRSYTGAVVATDRAVIFSGVENTREGQRHGLAAFDRRTGALLPWFADVAGAGNDFAVAGGRLYVSAIGSIGGVSRQAPAAFDLATGAPVAWTPPGPIIQVSTIAVAGDQVAIGGGFRMIGGLARRDLAAVDLRTNTVLPAFDAKFGPYYDLGLREIGAVRALAVAGGSLWAGGDFNRVADQDRPFLTRLDLATGALGPAPAAPSWTVKELYAQGGLVYVGGDFQKLGGQDRNKVGALDAANGALAPFAPKVDCAVNSFAPLGGQLLLGGCFHRGTGTAGGLAVVDPASGSAGSVTPPAADPAWVDSVAPDGEGGAWIAGEYWVLGPDGPQYFGRMRADGSRDARAPLVDRNVYEVASRGGEAYLAGSFSTVGGQPRNAAAAVRASDGALLGWDPQPSGAPTVITPLANGDVLLAGAFDSTELAAAGGLARFGPERVMTPPQAIAPPTVHGERFVDDYLGGQSTDGGDFSGSPNRLIVRWLRCDGAGDGCVDTGWREDNRLLKPDDVGHRFRVEVVAINDGGASAPVRSAPGPLVIGPRPEGHNQPELAGEAKEGATLTMTSPGSFSGGPTSYRYEWVRCTRVCRTIAGATSPSLTLTGADVNANVFLRVIGSNAAGEGATRSRDFGPVEPAVLETPRNTAPPKIEGVIRNPTTLYLDPGTWTGYPDSFMYVWERCEADGSQCADAGRRGSTFPVGAADTGKRFRVTVYARRGNFGADPLATEMTAPIPAAGEPEPADEPGPPPPSGDDPPVTGGDDPPATGADAPPADAHQAADAGAHQPASASPPTTVAATTPLRVRVVSARLRGSRQLVVRLTASAPTRARVEFRRGGRALARAAVDLVGATRIRIPLTVAARKQLRRRGALTGRVVVRAGGVPLARGQPLTLR